MVVAAGAAVRGAGGCARPCVQSLSALCCASCSQALVVELLLTQLAAAPVAGALLAMVLAPCTLCCRLCLPTVPSGSVGMLQRFLPGLCRSALHPACHACIGTVSVSHGMGGELNSACPEWAAQQSLYALYMWRVHQLVCLQMVC